MTHDNASDDKTPPTEEPAPRKERVIHTRVPAVLERELKRLAESARMPVSNLIRAILEDAIDVADRAGGRVEEQLRHAVERVAKERDAIRERVRKLDPIEKAVAFQPVTLAAAAACARCARPLDAGADARLAILTEPGPPLFVCPPCASPRGAEPAGAPPAAGEQS